MTIDLNKLFDTSKLEDRKFSNTLLRAVKGLATDGFDYLKFRQSVFTLQEMDIDQATAFKSAFATASTMGMTKQKLLTSCKQYETVLNKERRDFAEALTNQIATKVDNKKQQKQDIKSQIQQAKNKILELEKQITLFEEKLDNLDEKIADDKAKIEATKGKFNNAYDLIYNSISKDIELIKQYL